MMRKAFFFFLLSNLAFIENSCTRNIPPPIPCTSISQTRNYAAVNRVDITGSVNVTLSTSCARQRITLSGDPRDLPNVLTYVKNGTLFLMPAKGYPHCSNLKVDICTRYLNSIRFQGHGDIRGTSLKTSLLDVFINNGGHTYLQGNLGVRQLELKGKGVVQIEGIKSYNLKLKILGSPKVQLSGWANLSLLEIKNQASLTFSKLDSKNLVLRQHGHSVMQLAGSVDKLDVELWDNSRFQGGYLQANTVFAKTHDHSLAEIYAIRRQHTLANDASDIYFYHIPELKTDFMACSGSVLDMRNWNNPYMQEYNQYNK